MTSNSHYKIFTDFDGTITKIDTLNMILDEFAISDWRSIEDRVTRHELSEKEALQAEFDLVNVSLDQALDFLKSNAQIDETFIPFVQWCKSSKIELIVLSGGFMEFINAIFKKYIINGLPVFSNSIQIKNQHWKVIQPNLASIKNLCNHCKTHHIVEAQKQGYKVVYIGDGNTDRCPAENADIIFAKESLAQFLKNKNIEFYLYKNFDDIQNQLNDFIKLDNIS